MQSASEGSERFLPGRKTPDQGLLVQVLKLMELETLRNSVVGLPGVNGLSVEQRKRLTIGVELVANPGDSTSSLFRFFQRFSFKLACAYTILGQLAWREDHCGCQTDLNARKHGELCFNGCRPEHAAA